MWGIMGYLSHGNVILMQSANDVNIFTRFRSVQQRPWGVHASYNAVLLP